MAFIGPRMFAQMIRDARDKLGFTAKDVSEPFDCLAPGAIRGRCCAVRIQVRCEDALLRQITDDCPADYRDDLKLVMRSMGLMERDNTWTLYWSCMPGPQGMVD